MKAQEVTEGHRRTVTFVDPFVFRQIEDERVRRGNPSRASVVRMILTEWACARASSHVSPTEDVATEGLIHAG